MTWTRWGKNGELPAFRLIPTANRMIMIAWPWIMDPDGNRIEHRTLTSNHDIEPWEPPKADRDKD
jgi:hypothetical protein